MYVDAVHEFMDVAPSELTASVLACSTYLDTLLDTVQLDFYKLRKVAGNHTLAYL